MTKRRTKTRTKTPRPRKLDTELLTRGQEPPALFVCLPSLMRDRASLLRYHAYRSNWPQYPLDCIRPASRAAGVSFYPVIIIPRRPSFCRRAFGVTCRHLLLKGVGKGRATGSGLYYTSFPAARSLRGTLPVGGGVHSLLLVPAALRTRFFVQGSVLYKNRLKGAFFCTTPATPPKVPPEHALHKKFGSVSVSWVTCMRALPQAAKRDSP